jgi:hypothetical protein
MTETPTENGYAAVVQPMMDFWSKAMEEGTRQMQTWLQGNSNADAGDLAAWRRRWLDALAQSLDAYMRTPIFLDGIRRSMQAASEFRGNLEDFAQESAREIGFPRMPDVSGLFERTQMGDEAILTRLARIEEKLEALENRLFPSEAEAKPTGPRGKSGRSGNRP